MSTFPEPFESQLIKRLEDIVKALDSVRNYTLDNYHPIGSQAGNCTSVQRELVLELHKNSQVAAGSIEAVLMRLYSNKNVWNKNE